VLQCSVNKDALMGALGAAAEALATLGVLPPAVRKTTL
jgi:hypothetical protein